jgi:hypothetical protein
LKRDRDTFRSEGVLFQREWVADAQRYVWTSECGTMRAGRNVGKPNYWSMVNDWIVGKNFASLKTAMLQAVMHRKTLMEAAE